MGWHWPGCGRPSCPREEPTTAKSPGAGPAYELIGKVAVMHEGRVKPLDTVAREEVKQIYGRETIKLRDPSEEIEKILDPESHARKAARRIGRSKSGGPSGPSSAGRSTPSSGTTSRSSWPITSRLRRRIVAETLATRLKAIADKSTTPDDEKAACRSWRPTASRPPPGSRPTSAAPSCRSKTRRPSPRSPPSSARSTSGSPRASSRRPRSPTRITPIPFIEWASELQEQKRQFDANPQSAPRLTEIERRAIEVAMRLSTYKAYSGERFQNTGLILIMPRPNNAKYLAETAKTIKEAREKDDPRDLPLFKLDELKAISTFWNDIPRDDRHDPTEDATFDERYTAWLRDNSVWVPLKVMLKSKPEELVEAGYPESQVRAFLDAYHELEQAESSSPGHVSEAAAAKFLTASRELGEAVNPTKYPDRRDDRARDPLQRDEPVLCRPPYAYGSAVRSLALEPGIRLGQPGNRRSPPSWGRRFTASVSPRWPSGSLWRSMAFTSACGSRAGPR